MEPYFSNAYNTDNTDKYNYLKNTTKRLLFIDSRDCNNSINETSDHGFNPAFPNPFNFNVKLESNTHKSIGIEPYRNIEKITLKHFGIPKIKKEHYVILDIPDFFDYLDSTDNKGSHRATTVLYYDTTLGDDTNVGTIKQSHETFEFEFNPKLNALNNLNISIRKHNGEAIKADDFEVVDDVDYAFLYDIHTTFLFEITYVP
mgnify:CR=1 FL=1